MAIITHNLSKHPLYSIWQGIKNRCYNVNVKCYKHYGGRGIKVCDDWKNNFKSFYDWAMKNGWKIGLQIDRIDNNGNYEPTNCRFVTQKINANNKRNNRWITINNRTQTLEMWARELNLHPTTLSRKLKKNINLENQNE